MKQLKSFALFTSFIAGTVSAQTNSIDEQLWIKAGFEHAVVAHVDLIPFYSSPSAVPQTRGLNLTAVIFRNTRWTDTEVIARTQPLVNVLSQCGVKLTDLRMITVDPPQGNVHFDGQVKQEPEELDDPHKREASVTKLLPESARPIAFYVQSITTDYAYANSAESELPEYANSPIVNTIWISRDAIYRVHEYNQDYSVEAHELGHVLGNLEHIYPPKLPGKMRNLMAADLFKTSSELNAQQCEKIRSSPLLHVL